MADSMTVLRPAGPARARRYLVVMGDGCAAADLQGMSDTADDTISSDSVRDTALGIIFSLGLADDRTL